MAGLAVIDFETTGLYRVDRAVEIAVILLEPGGTVEAEFTTLINPHRDVSAGDIHGITASDVTQAPTFADIAPYLAYLLAGRAIVAHNAWFDLSTLAREFTRAGVDFPGTVPTVCTMRMTSELLGEVRTLSHACDYLSIPYTDAHTAHNDAAACAELFRILTWGVGQPERLAGAGTFYWEAENDVGRLFGEECELDGLLGKATTTWPFYPQATTPTVCSRSDAVIHRDQQDNRIAAIIERLPAATSHPDGGTASNTGESVEYLALLDQVLMDRLVTDDEQGEIAEMAAALGLTLESADATHRRYLERLVNAALQDGIVTDTERDDLHRVCALLKIPVETLDTMLTAPTDEQDGTATPDTPTVTLQPGDRITMTGATTPSRSVLEYMAEAAGLEVGGVTKKCAMLVIADPNSQSAKARKARSYGVPVVSEQVFLYALEEMQRTQQQEATP